MKEKDLFGTVLFGGFRKTDVLEYIMSFEGKQDSDRSVLEEKNAKMETDNKTVKEELKTVREQLETAEEELDSVKEELELTRNDLTAARTGLDVSAKEYGELKIEYEQAVVRRDEAARQYGIMETGRAEAAKELEGVKKQLGELAEKNKKLAAADVNQEDREALSLANARCRELERQLDEAAQQIRFLTSSREKEIKHRTADVSYSLLLMKENVMDVVENYRTEMQMILRGVKETALTECDRLKKKNEELTVKLDGILEENKNLHVELKNRERELEEVRRQSMNRASSSNIAVMRAAKPDDILGTKEKMDAVVPDGLAGCLQGARDKIDSLVKETSGRLDHLFSDMM